MVTEGWDCVADFLDGPPNTFCHGRTGSFGIGRRPTIPTSKPDGSRQLLGYGIHLATGLGGTVGIVKTLSLLQIAPQLVNPLFVFCLGP